MSLTRRIAATSATSIISVALLAGAAHAGTYGDYVTSGYLSSYNCNLTSYGSGYCQVNITYGGKTTATYPSKYGEVTGCSYWGVPDGGPIASVNLAKLKGKYVAVIWSPISAGKEGAINCH